MSAVSRWLDHHSPKLALAPSLMLITVGVYGFIVFTTVLSFTGSKMLPSLNQWVGLLQYDHHFVMRGLTVDRAHGNLLKMDRFGHVGRAYHGLRPLKQIVRASRVRNPADFRRGLSSGLNSRANSICIDSRRL